MKNLTFTVFICLFTSISYSQDLTTDLLLHYPFDGNAEDISGNEFHAIPNATLTQDRFGNANSAYYFDGVDDYIDLPISPVLKPQLPITYSCWVKFDVIDGIKSVIATNDFATDSHSGAWINVSSNGAFTASIGNNTGNTSTPNRRGKTGTTILSPNVWYHLVAVITSPQDMDVYVDCRNDFGTYNGTASMMAYSSAPGSIGRKDSYYGGPASYFQGAMDDFRYWNRALTQEEVEYLCQFDLGLEEKEGLSNFSFKVFPNPANDLVQIQASNISEVEEFKILSVDGKEVMSSELNGAIDVSSLSQGMYTVSLFDKSGVVLGTQKLIIK